MSYQSVVLADSPLRYYRMNESSGTNVHDSGSQAQDGTLSGGVTLGQSGLVTNGDTSMLFASSGQISVPTTGLPTGANPWTWEIWTLLPTLTPPGGPFYCLGGWGNTSGNQFMGMYFRSTLNQWQVWSWADNPLHSANNSVAVSTLYYVVVTYDGTNVALNINNSQLASAAYAFNLVASQALIGTDPGSASFAGKLGQQAIYSGVLSAGQMTAHYNAGLATSLSTTLIRGHNRSRGHILEVESVYR